jgi:hypothetical protein
MRFIPSLNEVTRATSEQHRGKNRTYSVVVEHNNRNESTDDRFAGNNDNKLLKVMYFFYERG